MLGCQSTKVLQLDPASSCYSCKQISLSTCAYAQLLLSRWEVRYAQLDYVEGSELCCTGWNRKKVALHILLLTRPVTQAVIVCPMNTAESPAGQGWVLNYMHIRADSVSDVVKRSYSFRGGLRTCETSISKSQHPAPFKMLYLLCWAYLCTI